MVRIRKLEIITGIFPTASSFIKGLMPSSGVSRRQVVLILCLAWLGLTLVPAGAQAKIFPVAEIKSLITRHVESNMPWAAGAVRIGFPTYLGDVSLPGEEISCSIQGRTDETYIGDTSFLLKFYNGGVLVRQENVRVSLEVQREVVVAARNLVKNREITSQDVSLGKKWVKRLPLNAINTTSEVIGKVPILNLRADAEIARNILKEPLLVKRGAMVRILLEEGRLNITTLGVSEEDGIAAAVIKVKNIASNKVLYARVVGDAVVRVEF